jgi:hypothetical protein
MPRTPICKHIRPTEGHLALLKFLGRDDLDPRTRAKIAKSVAALEDQLHRFRCLREKDRQRKAERKARLKELAERQKQANYGL